MEAIHWYIIGGITYLLSVLGGFLLGRRSNRIAFGVSVPPSPEVVKKIEERLIKAEELNETTEAIIADINDLLYGNTDDGG